MLVDCCGADDDEACYEETFTLTDGQINYAE